MTEHDVDYDEWHDSTDSRPRLAPAPRPGEDLYFIHHPRTGPLSYRAARALNEVVEKVGGRYFGYPRVGVLQPLLALGNRKSRRILVLREQQAYLPCMLKRFRLPYLGNKEVAVCAIRLPEEVIRMTARQRSRVVRTLRSADTLYVFSNSQVAEVTELLGQDVADRIIAVPYGIDTDFFSPAAAPASEPVDIVAAGRDYGRDYRTLFRAIARADSALRVRLLCQPYNIEGLTVPTNVDVVGFVNMSEFRRHLASASVVVVPSRPLRYPTGQTVLLQAMALGKLCIVSGGPALREYVEPGVTALWVPPHDPAALLGAIETAVSDAELRRRIGANARQAVTSTFSLGHMWDALLADR